MLIPELVSLNLNPIKMRVTIISIPVRDQEKALQFYTGKLGFLKKLDMPLGGGNRWLTLVSKEAQDGPEILLEPAPLHFEPSKVFHQLLFMHLQTLLHILQHKHLHITCIHLAFHICIKGTLMHMFARSGGLLCDLYCTYL